MISGVFNDGDRDYPAGSFIHAPAGSSHVPQTTTGCTLFLFYPEGWITHGYAALLHSRPSAGNRRRTGVVTLRPQSFRNRPYLTQRDTLCHSENTAPKPGGDGMGRIGRWMIAIAVTVAAFTAGLVVSGLWILPRWVASSADRWVIAAACGTVVAALATAWAYDFARSAPTPDAGHTPSVDPPARNVTVHGDNQGIISTGDNADNQLQ